MSSAGETEISNDEVVRVELCDNGDGEHTYDGSGNGWDHNIGQSMTNDDDEDNWSRQVETDDILHRMPSSVTGGDTITIGDDDDDDGQGASTIAAENGDGQRQPVLIPQPRPLPTMKEKMVERERQRRVESERARWKRQFAMAAHAEAENDEDDNNHGSSGDTNHNRDNITSGSVADHDQSFVNDRNSVAGTVGEDTVAPIDTLEEHSNNENMNYPMERFLQDQQGTELEDENNNKKKETQGVVMERFLQEHQPTAVGGAGGSLPPSSVHSLHGSVANESSIRQIIDDDLPLMNLPPAENTTDMIESTLPGETIDDHTFQSPPQQPRVLRLTEAEIQEMAAIDDASRSNAPPSERDDMSELGELVSDFGLTHIDNQNMSQGTPVTALESVTSSVGNQIGQITVLSGSSSGHGVIDALEAHSISSNVVASSAGGDVSLTGNPPSVVADDDTRGILSPRSSQVPTEILPTTTTVEVPTSPYATIPVGDTSMSNNGPGDELKLPPDNEIIVNRTMRPGLFNYKEHQQANSLGNIQDPYSPEEREKRANRQIPTDVDHHIEGFDFDKDNYASPPQGDIVATPNDMWSPGFSDSSNVPDYGAIAPTEDVVENLQLNRFASEPEVADEKKALLGGVPPAVNVTMKSHPRKSPRLSLLSVRSQKDLVSLVENVFSDIQYENSLNDLSISTEPEDNLDSTLLKAVVSGRMLPLMATLLLEMPTLFLVAGGSDGICSLIGRTKFTTLVALLPMVSALSGNVALQASSLTTAAIRSGSLKVENYTSWLAKEMKTAGFLGKYLIGSVFFEKWSIFVFSHLSICVTWNL